MGHLSIAKVMVEATDLDKVWFVVSPQNPFKSSSALAHEFDRIDMVNAAIIDDYDFKACDVEFNMPKPSYTIDTLTYLSDKHPQYSFKLIIGEDNLIHFNKWKNHEALIDNYGLYVYPRPNVKHTHRIDHENIRYIDAPLIDISATFIRKSVRENKSIQYLVPDSVMKIINERKLFM